MLNESELQDLSALLDTYGLGGIAEALAHLCRHRQTAGHMDEDWGACAKACDDFAIRFSE